MDTFDFNDFNFDAVDPTKWDIPTGGHENWPSGFAANNISVPISAHEKDFPSQELQNLPPYNPFLPSSTDILSHLDFSFTDTPTASSTLQEPSSFNNEFHDTSPIRHTLLSHCPDARVSNRHRSNESGCAELSFQRASHRWLVPTASTYSNLDAEEATFLPPISSHDAGFSHLPLVASVSFFFYTDPSRARQFSNPCCRIEFQSPAQTRDYASQLQATVTHQTDYDP
jgi:hypothetical protein